LVAAGFSLRLHRLESLCYQLTAKWYKSPFLKGDLEGLLSTYIIPPYPPLEKGGKNPRFKCHIIYDVSH